MKLFNKIKNYLKGSISEMKKVVWPTKKQTINYSMIVIALSLGMALFFGVMDYVFKVGLEAIISNNRSAITAPVELPTPDIGGLGVETEPVSYPTKPAK